MNDDTRARFFTAIAQQLPAERVIEVHLFPAIKQGGVESGVAVLAVERDIPAPALDVIDVTDVASDSEASPYAEESAVPAAPVVRVPPSRYIVYSARYRHTLKGMDRGKWEVSVTDEADAPLLTIDAVVRGVQRRSGDVDDTMRLSGDEFRATLPAHVP